jgi:hypothetical protein
LLPLEKKKKKAVWPNHSPLAKQSIYDECNMYVCNL